MLNCVFVYLKIGNDIKSSFGTVATSDGLSQVITQTQQQLLLCYHEISVPMSTTLCPKKTVHLFIFQITMSKIDRF